MAKRLIDENFCTKNELVLLDEQPAVGGLWSAHSFANVGARVQTLEPMLRLVDPPPEVGKHWPDMTPRADFIQEFDYLIKKYDLHDRIQLNVKVEKAIEDPSGTSTLVSCTRKEASGGS